MIKWWTRRQKTKLLIDLTLFFYLITSTKKTTQTEMETRRLKRHTHNSISSVFIDFDYIEKSLQQTDHQ